MIPWRRDKLPIPVFLAFPGGSDSKESAWNAGDLSFDPWVGKIPWRRAWQPTPVFLLGKSHGQRSLASYGPWGHKESDTTEQLSTAQHSKPPWRASLVAQWSRIHQPMQETWDRSLGWADTLEKEMATHSSILAWRISWTEEPGELQFMGSQRVRNSLVAKQQNTLEPPLPFA